MSNFYERNRLTILLLLLATLLIIILTKGKTIMAKAITAVWDFISERRIDTLHPLIRARVREFINAADNVGIKLRVTQATRTFAEQQKIYNQGRTEPGDIVTNAQAGQSYHNYGLAFDVVEMVNGEPIWNSTNWEKIGELGKKFGFQWGGDFTSIKDKPHFQKTFGNSITMLMAKYNSGNLPGGYVTVA